jgi:hypothetical protein
MARRRNVHRRCSECGSETGAGPGKAADSGEAGSQARICRIAITPASGTSTSRIQTGAVESTLDLKVDGKKVTGTLQSQMGEAKVEGEIADGKLTFWFSMDANGQTLNITFVGTSQKDGSLAGTLSFGQGDLNWTATKAKN